MRLIDADDLKRWSEEIEYTFDGGIDINQFNEKIEQMPTIDAVPVIRCKDCKYFNRDHWGRAGDIPLIVAHCVCTKWGDGCCTDENGYCFLGESF